MQGGIREPAHTDPGQQIRRSDQGPLDREPPPGLCGQGGGLLKRWAGRVLGKVWPPTQGSRIDCPCKTVLVCILSWASAAFSCTRGGGERREGKSVYLLDISLRLRAL